ncbi:hypothetical protein HJ590_05090 [Naumannella sp. ID2617S]|nr:hypothetical protein [Naumannella sp. ID2617S]
MRILTVSDSDSYLKWVVSTFEDAPADWRVRHLVLENVIAPSPAQVAAVQGGYPIQRGSVRRLLALAAERPEVIVLACTGPALEVALSVLAAGGALRPHPGRPRPVLVGGLPGISYPANDLAIRHRRHLDLMLLHSHREMAAYAEVVQRLRAAGESGPELALATLPYLREVAVGRGGSDVVFAAQSLVPALREDRVRVLDALAAVPPELNPVVKIRAVGGERQAHNEAYPYAELWQQRPRAGRREVEFRAGRMADALAEAYGFATVSSTAAIEAIAARVPLLILGDFGVGAEQINLVFADSGLVGDLDDLRTASFRHPEPDWLQQNYLHDPSENTWRGRLAALVATREELPPVRFRGFGSVPRRTRRFLRLVPRRPG